MKNSSIYISTLALFSLLSSCNKEWLNQKPESSMTVVERFEDYQLLMNNSNLDATSYHALMGTDEYYIPENLLTDAINYFGNSCLELYSWQRNGSTAKGNTNWFYIYQAIFTSNLTIDGLRKMGPAPGTQSEFDKTLGKAHYLRATLYFELLLSFSKPYDATTAATDPGVPLRLEADITQTKDRASIQNVYDQVINDLNEAVILLPETGQQYLNYPLRAGAYGMLSRVYMSMSKYPEALDAAEKALEKKNTLLDFNTLGTPTDYVSMPPMKDNPELMTIHGPYGVDFFSRYFIRMHPDLYNSYNDNDLRKTLFFIEEEPGTYFFRGSYYATSGSFFTGIAVNELYLNRAECLARRNETSNAMDILNQLLIKRWKQGTFQPLTATTAPDALNMILAERKKELIFRGTRWMDMRRLNKEPNYQITVTRTYNGETFTLSPNSNLYAWIIPFDEIQYSGIAQNPR